MNTANNNLKPDIQLEEIDQSLRRKRLPKLKEIFGINSTRDIITKVAWLIVFLVLAVFLIRVAVWEDHYYKDMEGKPRAVVAEEVEEVEEEKPTETEVITYTVPAAHPRYLSINNLGIINARVLALGQNKKGQMDTPKNIFDVGWYEGSSTPGAGGTILIDGHNGGPHVQGVFKNLTALAIGDTITIERGDGAIFHYSVVENKSVALDQADSYMRTALTSPVHGKESVTLITCSGDWSNTQKTYLSRQFVRAVITD